MNGKQETRAAILDAITEHGPTTKHDIADATGYAPKTVQEHARDLDEAGEIVRRKDPTNPRRWLYHKDGDQLGLVTAGIKHGGAD